MQEIMSKYQFLSGKKIIENLKRFGFYHEHPNFTEACLAPIQDFYGEKETTYEDLLAILIRLNIMYFVKKRRNQNMWFLILTSLFPEELQKAPPSKVVEEMENQFIKYMEMFEAMGGDEAIKQGVMKFLFLENNDFTQIALTALHIATQEIQKMLN
jgi:hypothetical protein